MPKGERALYMVIDLKDPYELPLMVGTMSEVTAYTGKTSNAIKSAIRHSKQRGYRCSYIRVRDDMED